MIAARAAATPPLRVQAEASMRTLGRTTRRARRCSGQITAFLQKTWVRVALLLVVAFVAHLPSLQGQLIWDDNYLVGDNPFFRSPIFSGEVFRHYLYLDSLSTHYRPVQNLSYMLDYLLWNGDLYGYHLSNVLWHAGAGVVLYFLLRKLLPTLGRTEQGRGYCETGAFLVALLWAVHPVHSAAVDYISGRADSLAFVFSCGAWLMYLRAPACSHRMTRVLAYVAAAILLLLGLCAREIACIWEALFLVHLLVFTGDRSRRTTAFTVAGCLLMLALYAGLRSLPDRRPFEPENSNWSGITRAGLMLRALGDYTRLTVFPTGLHMERNVMDARIFKPAPGWRDQLSLTPLSYLGLCAAAGLLAGALKRGVGQRLRIFGAFWFLAAFLPISNLVEMNATSAEHWLYLPLVGLLLVFFGWMIEVPERVFRLATVGALFAAGVLSARSTVRSSDWLNAKVFYERTIAASGWSPRVGLNLAIIYENEGRYLEARRLLERTLAFWPDCQMAQSHLALTLIALGENTHGDAVLAAAAASAPGEGQGYPRNWVASYQLARKEYDAGRVDRALALLVETRKRFHEEWPLVAFESEIVRKNRGPDAAVALVEKFAQANWWQYPAFLALGKLKAQQGDGAGALAALRHACRLDIRETEALNLMTRIEMRAENFPAALVAQERAVSRQPGEPSQYLLYSEVLLQMGRTEQAQKALETAKRLKGHAST